MEPSDASIKTILRDLSELEKAPMSGISLYMPDNSNPFLLHGSLILNNDNEKRFAIHFHFKIPSDYPIGAPAVNISPDPKLGLKLEESIVENSNHENPIYAELTRNFALYVETVHGPSKSGKGEMTQKFTLSSILVYLKTFFAYPYLSKEILPSEENLLALQQQTGDANHKLKNGSDEIPFNQEEISNKLTCSISLSSIFDIPEPILGYPLDLSNDKFGRIWVTPLIEIMSYEAFILNFPKNAQILQDYHKCKFKSGLGMNYNFWLPIYINKNHFERSKQHVFDAISFIYKNTEGVLPSAFNPVMTLKVLPPIIVKIIVHFVKGTIHQSIPAIEAYCQLYRLFAKLVEMFPELQQAIDTEVENFCHSEKNRHKKVAGDLGEFMIKLALSTKGINNPKILNALLKEYLARQIFWACKANRDLNSRNKCPNFLRTFMEATKVSNHFFLIQLETAQLLLDKRVISELDNNYGILNETRMKAFRNRLEWVQNNVLDNWKTFIEGINQQEYIKNDQTMIQYVLEGYNAAQDKGYMK
jgi:hypothetical protein